MLSPAGATAPSVQYRKPSVTVWPANADRSAVRSTHAPPELPVMPLPKFWPFGFVALERFVATGVPLTVR